MPGCEPIRTLEASECRRKGELVETYVILRRNGWRRVDDLEVADGRSIAEAACFEEVDRIRSYVLEERDGSVGTICIYRASSPEAIRRHSENADLPIDEIVKVADTVVAQPDPAATAAERGESNR